MLLGCGRFQLDLGRPKIMAIVNVTEDSFSGDGVAETPEKAIALAYRQLENGADLLDLGAESSRPGAQATRSSRSARVPDSFTEKS